MGDDLDCVSFGEHPVEGSPLATPVRVVDYLSTGETMADTRIRVFRGLKVATGRTALRGEVVGHRDGY